MALIITEPTPGDFRTYKNGVIIFRAMDFAADARGSLTTTSDSSSVGGTVLVDSQTVTTTGSNPNKQISITSADETIFIDKNTLFDVISDEFDYTVLMSIRCEGAVDPTTRNGGHTFLKIGSNSASIIYGSRLNGGSYSTMGTIAYTPKSETQPFYKVIAFNGPFNTAFFNPDDEGMFFKAASTTGGDLEYFIDCVWFVPTRANDFDGELYDDSDFAALADPTFWDPVYINSLDDYDISRDEYPLDWAGQFSVMVSAPPSSGEDDINGSMAEFQEGNHEKCLYNVNGYDYGQSNWDNEESTDMTFVFGSHFVPAQEVDTDSFTRNTGSGDSNYIGESDQGRVWQIVRKHPFEASVFGSGINCDGSQLVFLTGKYDALVFPYTYNDTSDAAVVHLGEIGTETGTGATSLGHQTLGEWDFGTLQVKTTIDHLLFAGHEIQCGFGALDEFYGVNLYIAQNGVLNARLVYMPKMHEGIRLDGFGLFPGLPPTDIDFGDTILNVSNSYTAGTYINVKCEKMWYKYRAKVWLEGDSEPGDWQIEGFIPSGNVSTTRYPYPYDTDPNFGIDRRSSYVGYVVLGQRFFGPYEHLDGTPWDQPADVDDLRFTTVYFDDLVLTKDDYGDPGDVHLKLLKYDESINLGQINLDHKSQRVIISPKRKHKWNNDHDGYAVRMWKDVGSAWDQSAVLSDMYQKEKRMGPIHLNMKFRAYAEDTEEPMEEEEI